jgi:sec-independent protein translocase protein TatA
MPNVGPMEIALVLVIALVIFGPKRLPELGKSMGKGIREFKGSLSTDEKAEIPAASSIKPTELVDGEAVTEHKAA